MWLLVMLCLFSLASLGRSCLGCAVTWSINDYNKATLCNQKKLVLTLRDKLINSESRCCKLIAKMKFLYVTYELFGRSGRREYVMPCDAESLSAIDIASALIKHEFAEVDWPFNPKLESPEAALRRFCIVNVSYQPVHAFA